ncbi:hypothetical protein [Aquimarina megaterium]|uniref:hypothetical protein n=1 Tax=Aquimarina megaterium TaxID=1443666 RepID=UPI000945751E|nr:hypothetical protein [Aquimarina megaterium]
MELKKIKKIHNIKESDFVSFDEDIKKIETKLGIEFPKILYDFYRKIGVHSSIFRWVLIDLNINNYGYLEINTDAQTGDKWAINITENNSLFFKPFKEKWIKVEYSVEEFLLHEIHVTSCFSLKFSAEGKYTEQEFIRKVNDGFFRKIKIEPIDLDIANIYSLKMNFYETCINDIVGINGDSMYYASNNKSDFEKVTSSFGEKWHVVGFGYLNE